MHAATRQGAVVGHGELTVEEGATKACRHGRRSHAHRSAVRGQEVTGPELRGVRQGQGLPQRHTCTRTRDPEAKRCSRTARASKRGSCHVAPAPLRRLNCLARKELHTLTRIRCGGRACSRTEQHTRTMTREGRPGDAHGTQSLGYAGPGMRQSRCRFAPKRCSMLVHARGTHTVPHTSTRARAADQGKAPRGLTPMASALAVSVTHSSTGTPNPNSQSKPHPRPSHPRPSHTHKPIAQATHVRAQATVSHPGPRPSPHRPDHRPRPRPHHTRTHKHVYAHGLAHTRTHIAQHTAHTLASQCGVQVQKKKKKKAKPFKVQCTT
jgi:hypothetical protein